MLIFDDNRPEFLPYGLRCDEWRGIVMTRPDRHNDVEVNFFVNGGMTYLLGGRKVTIPPGRLAIFWGTVPHQILAFDSSDPYYVLTLPLAWFMGVHFPAKLVVPLLHGSCIVDPSPLGGGCDEFMFKNWVADFQSGRNNCEHCALHEIEARLLRLAVNLPELDATSGAKSGHAAFVDTSGLGKVEQIAAYIAQHFTSNLSVKDIGQAVGLNPNYAMSLFQSSFGTTLVSYLTELRLSNAQRLLATTRESISDIAMNSGFNSISRFNTVFKEKCGCSPREFREREVVVRVPSATSACHLKNS